MTVGSAGSDSVRDGGDAAGPLHDEADLHVGEAVLFGLGAALVGGGHVQVEAQRHRLLPELRVPPEERALPLLDHLVDLLRPAGGKTKLYPVGTGRPCKHNGLWTVVFVQSGGSLTPCPSGRETSAAGQN